jgi:hypothetical protein
MVLTDRFYEEESAIQLNEKELMSKIYAALYNLCMTPEATKSFMVSDKG